MLVAEQGVDGTGADVAFDHLPVFVPLGDGIRQVVTPLAFQLGAFVVQGVAVGLQVIEPHALRSPALGENQVIRWHFLVSAVGFAWLATTFDAKRQSSQMTAVSASGETLMETIVEPVSWTPPAESAAPLLPKAEWQEAVKESIRSLPTEETQPAEEGQSRPEMVEMPAEIVTVEEAVSEVMQTEVVSPEPAPDQAPEAVIETADKAEIEIAAIAVEPSNRNR